MKSVTQEDAFGCGLACVAFILKKPYKITKEKYFPAKNVEGFGLVCKEIVQGLRKAGKEYEYKYIKKRMNFKVNTIVFIKRSQKYPAGHYLVKSRQGWMDSWINFSSKNQDVKKAKSGFRKKLPSKAIYAVFLIK